MNAAAHSDLSRVRRLIDQGADVRERGKHGETALYYAIDRRLGADNPPVVEALLKAGADPSDPGLAVALTRDYGNPSVTLLLIHAGARIPLTCDRDDSLLSLATQESTIEVMRALIARGAPVNCQDKWGGTALYFAATNGEVDKVGVLLRSGADPHLLGPKPLEIATTTNPDPRVQAEFVETRELLQNAVAHTQEGK
jgi:ankyrin repeat protein